jgi:DNA polymerase III subunit delta'
VTARRAQEKKAAAKGFATFLGNERIVQALRRMLGSGRLPNALLFAGPRGIGKYTLAWMFAAATNCERLKDDFCGECDACRRITALADPKPLIKQGLEERGESMDAAGIERTPLILETHPDVWAIVPDPVRLRNPVARPVIRMGQLRAVQRAAYFLPAARRRVFILDEADTMRRDYASIFLKILEEPPETATLILTAPSPDMLLPTIRSRCLVFPFAPVANELVEEFLRERTKRNTGERRLAAVLAGGSPGRALALDLEKSARLRRDALGVLRGAVEGGSAHELFQGTAHLVKNSEEERFENILELFYSLLLDLLEQCSGPKQHLPRNPDLQGELTALARKVNLEWISNAADSLDRLSGGLRRNINRQLALDAAAMTWETTSVSDSQA